MNKFFFFVASFFFCFACNSTEQKKPLAPPVPPLAPRVELVDVYLTTANESMLFQHSTVGFLTGSNMSPHTIRLDPTTVYQQMDGFGVAITGSSCSNLLKMSTEKRDRFLKETFEPDEGMGYSYIRISLGCSDFSLDEYTYCDTQGIENFAIHDIDKRDLIPILKEILAINPKLKIMASPWTCPRWMKVNNLKQKKPYNSWTSGQLNPDYYADYATYFVKYIQAMQAEGIGINSVTIQNEPLNRGNSASLYMTWEEQRDFIKKALGPAFSSAGIKTEIIVYDHNYNYDNTKGQNSFPTKIYADSEASQYIAGAAFHAYGGDKSELLKVHKLNPEKGLFFTEVSIGEWGNGYSFASDLMWNMKEVCIGTINNFCKAVIVWNFMLDNAHGPYRPGGCTNCLGAVTINSDYSTIKRNSHYYTISHLSKVIKQGANRIKTSGFSSTGLYYSAFENPDGSYSLVAQNDTGKQINIVVEAKERSFSYNIPSKSVVSFSWK